MKADQSHGYGASNRRRPPFTPEFYAGCSNNGLVCCGWHTPWARVQPEKWPTQIRLTGRRQQVLIIPWLKSESHQDWLTKAAEMNALADENSPYASVCGLSQPRP
jgi:hypothetical protein